eukprot:6477042-Prymnesium_polylepis.1
MLAIPPGQWCSTWTWRLPNIRTRCGSPRASPDKRTLETTGIGAEDCRGPVLRLYVGARFGTCLSCPP